MEEIEKNLNKIRSKIDILKKYKEVKIVAVSKKKSWQEISKAYDNGINDFGENYLQESIYKIPKLNSLDITWHFIGHIQSNKCRDIAEKFDWVHTIDRVKVARLLDKFCPENKELRGLIQINIDNEESKSGIKLEEIENFLEDLSDLKRVKLCGLMIIPNPNVELIGLKETFKEVKKLSDKLQKEFLDFTEISMGMSRDFELAIQEGSTIVRLGESIFGARK